MILQRTITIRDKAEPNRGDEFSAVIISLKSDENPKLTFEGGLFGSGILTKETHEYKNFDLLKFITGMQERGFSLISDITLDVTGNKLRSINNMEQIDEEKV